jgi:hypothetical protein
MASFINKKVAKTNLNDLIILSHSRVLLSMNYLKTQVKKNSSQPDDISLPNISKYQA